MEPEVHNFLRLYFMRYAVSEFKKKSIFDNGFPGKKQKIFGVLLHNNHSKTERKRGYTYIHTYIRVCVYIYIIKKQEKRLYIYTNTSFSKFLYVL